jgi:hypothetical protein
MKLLCRFGWLAWSFPALLTLSCAHVGSSTKGDLTLYQVHLQVEDAMLRYRNKSIGGDLAVGQRKAVEQAYEEYEPVYNDAVEKAGGKEQARFALAAGEVRVAAERVIASVSQLP